MRLAAAEGLEVHAAEFAGDVLGVAGGRDAGFEPGCHDFDFVLGEVCPICAVDVAFFAVVVVRVVDLVGFHFLQGGERMGAVGVRAGELLDAFES